MLWALIKKQLFETVNILFKGKRRSSFKKRHIIAAIVIAVFLLGYLGVATFFMTGVLAEGLVAIDKDWLYFTLVGVFAGLFGIIGSVFTSYTALYDAKDNDLLLAMPIPPRTILTVRMLGVYLTALLFEALVYLPATVAYLDVKGIRLAPILTALPIIILLPLISTALSCLLGWVIALIASRIRHKNVITVIVSVAFLMLYFRLFSVTDVFMNISESADTLADATKLYLYPFYALGKGALGNTGMLLIFAAVAVVAILIAWLPVSASLLRLATIKRGSLKKKYVSKEEKASSQSIALFRKELARFLGSATYMLNCGLGSVMVLVIAGATVVNHDTLSVFIGFVDGYLGNGSMGLVLAGIMCFISATNMVTAPSVSLEGSSIYILQSLPVSAAKALWAKVMLHLAITLPPVLISVSVISIACGIGFADCLAAMNICALFILLTAQFNLLINLRFPNLSWKNESVAVKQSVSAFLSMFGNWIIVVSIGGVCTWMLFKDLVPPVVLIISCIAALAALNVLCYRLLKTYGVKRFASI